jgi:hypothetical protein
MMGRLVALLLLSLAIAAASAEDHSGGLDRCAGITIASEAASVVVGSRVPGRDADLQRSSSPASSPRRHEVCEPTRMTRDITFAFSKLAIADRERTLAVHGGP